MIRWRMKMIDEVTVKYDVMIWWVRMMSLNIAPKP